ncbi:MAG: hypothetical protein ACXVKD_10730 [Candidatus Angelobacter sp.]
MKQAEQATVVLNLENVLAGRIWTEFRNDPQHQVLAKKFEAAIQDALRKHKQTAPDEALIPVTAHLTEKEAKTILTVFKRYAGALHDDRVLKTVSDALKES